MTDPSIVHLLREDKRWFTPTEASAALPHLLPLIKELIERVERAQEVETLLSDGAVAVQSAVHRDLSELREAARDALASIEAHGVEVRSLCPVVLDFPALHRGRVVCLSWKQGEKSVTWWHPLHAGTRDRQPVDADGLAAWEYWS